MFKRRPKKRTEWRTLSNGEKIRFSSSKQTWVFEDGTPYAQTTPHQEALSALEEEPHESSDDAPQASSSTTVAPISAMARASLRDPATLGVSGTHRAGLRSSSGVRQVTGHDPASGVQTKWEIGPSRRVPGNRTQATKKVRGSARDEGPEDGEGDEDDEDGEGDEDDEDDDDVEGDDEYKRSRRPTRDYRFGNVIEILLVPPPAEALSAATTVPSTVRYPSSYHTGRRRFIVMRPSTEVNPSFMALPIKIYGGHGVAAPNVIKAHHAIVYTRAPATMTAAERPQRHANGSIERGMQAQPIRVVPLDRTVPLDPMARLDLFDEHEFDADIPHAKVYGRVHDSSRAPLRFQYEAVHAEVQRLAAQPRRATNNVVDGAISLEQMTQTLQELNQRAHSLQLLAVPELSLQQRLLLARDAHTRQSFINRIHEAWRPTLLARRNAQNAANHDDGDTDEDEDDQRHSNDGGNDSDTADVSAGNDGVGEEVEGEDEGSDQEEPADSEDDDADSDDD